ncbi:MAG: 50S ribosomal protein L5 [Candidatus Harrisonbacteria bacterium CG10_big_fil_rev_8_21_14_0_10_49_15]|uniref:50S ribosomal protein L5 n=1 Tax=Candidatus Harrisonbacteria bacterium CG10_big_fil_rev_8_21_14_0_10_49_15 TaxID=1974587 RepID=A0A2H0UKY1_9BACT|nr:MAG: 50S ribosomal protein L5 [Candidatus Harrisonbacteria bacterium CG10_big_fil_rev_8_21_14_0_10_49_15]
MKNSIEKVVVNTSFGKQATAMSDFESKVLPEIRTELAAIIGQMPQVRPARKSIAGFKLREGMAVGMRATLRGAKARQFVSRVVNIVLPRIRDFRGIKLSGIDRDGNLTFGIKEHIVFPEIVLEESKANFGLQITVVPREPMENEEAIAFYRELGIPFEKEAVATR